MGRRPSEQPEAFAVAVAAEIRKEMGVRRLSGRALGRLIGRSESYVRERISDKLEFSLNDVERFCFEIGIKPEELIARVDTRLTSEAPNSVSELTAKHKEREEREWRARHQAAAHTGPAEDNLEEDRD